MFEILNLVSTICLIPVLPYWGTAYLIGWLLGVTTLLNSGFIGPLDLFIFFIISIIILILRISKF